MLWRVPRSFHGLSMQNKWLSSHLYFLVAFSNSNLLIEMLCLPYRLSRFTPNHCLSCNTEICMHTAQESLSPSQNHHLSPGVWLSSYPLSHSSKAWRATWVEASLSVPSWGHGWELRRLQTTSVGLGTPPCTAAGPAHQTSAQQISSGWEHDWGAPTLFLACYKL